MKKMKFHNLGRKSLRVSMLMQTCFSSEGAKAGIGQWLINLSLKLDELGSF